MKDWIAGHARAAYWIWVALCLPLVGVLNALELPLLTVYLVCLCWIAGGWLLINYGTFRGLRRCIRTLDRECDPEPMLEACRTVLRQNPKSVLYRVNGGFALLLLGRREEAAAELAGLEAVRRLWKNAVLTVPYCACRADLADDPEEAGAWLDRLEQEAGRHPGTARVLEEQRACLALRRGETEGLEPVFLAALERAEMERARVSWHWTLAALYRLEGREAEAREHLAYVAEHGNKLYVRAEAEKLLEQDR